MTHVLILAAGSVAGKIPFLHSRCESPALIPLNTRPLAAYLIEFYGKNPDCETVLVVGAVVADIVRAELGMLSTHCKVRPLTASSGVVDSLTQASADLADSDDLIVNLVTTIPTELVGANEVFIAREVGFNNSWSGIALEGDQVHFSFKSKPKAKPGHAFTGIFRTSVATLRQALAATQIKDDLLAVVAAIEANRRLHYRQTTWLDCGHEINYYEAKARHISSRSFNRIDVSLEDGVLWKRSAHSEKLERETNYVTMLPADIQVFFPRVLRRLPAAAGGLAAVQLEYYGYPSVAEYFLYWDLSTDNWRRLFSRLTTVLRRFASHPYSLSPAACEDFYFTKTVDRVEQFFASVEPEMRSRLGREVTINGRRCNAFASLKADLRARLQRIYREQDFGVMHGDFCFNNLLYDIPSGIVRLIDPRGSFGDRCVGIYGDRKYDLAKLKHSAEHGYDFIVNGLYTLNISGGNIDFTIARRECSDLVAGLSHDTTAALGGCESDIELLTSLLFLSMCPLHADDRSRQMILFAHGLSLLNAALDS